MNMIDRKINHNVRNESTKKLLIYIYVVIIIRPGLNFELFTVVLLLFNIQTLLK